MSFISSDSTSIYQFKVKDINGKTFDFATLKGKKIMVVNTASKCGLTPQYEQLEALYTKNKAKNFVIVGFPANDFMSQEPGTDQEIQQFCKLNYGVSFPMMSKISVKGKEMAPIYQFLTQKAKNGKEDSKVEWNFQKYLIDENGHLAKVISPRVLPDDPSIIAWIEK
ncbi:MAG: Glutathione peroxidase BsaA [Bacteroidota bacterium]|jgi:glutathione peroxidase